ncbi:MAG: hypothetical protein ACP5T6_03735, partial [Candidatus Micrarchaeia archaeon]
VIKQDIKEAVELLVKIAEGFESENRRGDTLVKIAEEFKSKEPIKVINALLEEYEQLKKENKELEAARAKRLWTCTIIR